VSIVLNLSELGPAPQQRHEALATAWCAERAGDVYRALDSELAVALQATQVADVVDVAGTVHGRFGFDCSRCAEPSELTIAEPFVHHFVGRGQLDAGEGSEVQDFDADPDVSEHDGVHIYLDELVIEHALLALPPVPLCRADCRGLCPQCGANLNQTTCACAPLRDQASPWAALQDFKVAGGR
jgi:uncharacterized protein